MSRKKQITKTVCFRCPVDLVDRLEDAKWTNRKNKTDILVEALEKHLTKLEIKQK